LNYKNWWIGDSFGSRYPSNQTRQWCDSDKPDNCTWDPPDREPLTYDFNQYGFRSGPLVRAPRKINIIVSGCSHTVGIGLPLEHTWPRILESMIPTSVVHNVAMGGASTDFVVRATYLADQIVNADMFFILWPDPSRIEICREEQPENFSVQHPEYPMTCLDETHHMNLYRKNLIFLKMMTGNRPLYHGNQGLARSPDGAPRARDGIHNCKEWNKFLAEAFLIKHKENDQDSRFSVAQDIIDYEEQHADKKI